MNPDNAIAVRVTEVDNANLYFSSWISFAAAVFLAGSLAQETLGLDVRQAPAKQARWFALAASSMVVLFASVRIHRNEDVRCEDNPTQDLYDLSQSGQITLAGTEFCKRVNLGIALGVLTFLASAGFSFGAALLPFAGLMELALTAVLLVMWCFGVGFITFGGDLSPGTHIGNLYFATWISFGLTVSEYTHQNQNKHMVVGSFTNCIADFFLSLFFHPYPQVMLFSDAFREFVSGPAQTSTTSDANGDPDLGPPAPAPTQIPEEDDI